MHEADSQAAWPSTSLAQAARLGIAYLPRDRRATGIFPASPCSTISPSRPCRASPAGLRPAQARCAQRLAAFRDRLSMVYGAASAPIGTLSGGNQQKVLLARWLACEPRLLLLNDPTRGVDLGTRLKLYEVFRGLARDDGIPLVVLSSEIEEVLQLCDRVLVFREQGVARELAGSELAMDRVIAAMFGQEARVSRLTGRPRRSCGWRRACASRCWRSTYGSIPARFAPASLGITLGLAAPLILAAAASMPPILAGRGGIDLSVGPLMGLVNVVVVRWLVEGLGWTSPFADRSGGPAARAGLRRAERLDRRLSSGSSRSSPRSGTSLLYAGLALTISPSPTGTAPAWLKSLAGPWSWLPLAAVAVAWLLLKRLPYYEQLMAVGSDDRAAYTAGVPVAIVRFLAYVLAGLFAAVGGLCLTGLIGSADPNVAANYTLLAISAVALGGVSLAGGSGGLAAAVLGAVEIFLLQSGADLLQRLDLPAADRLWPGPDVRRRPELRSPAAGRRRPA